MKKRRKMVDTTTHSCPELILEFSHHSGWLKRGWQILQERRNDFSKTIQLNGFAEAGPKFYCSYLPIGLRLILSLPMWVLLSHIFWVTVLKAHLLRSVQNVQNTVATCFSTISLTLPDGSAVTIVSHSALGGRAHLPIRKTNVTKLQFPVCFQPPGRSSFFLEMMMEVSEE